MAKLGSSTLSISSLGRNGILTAYLTYAEVCPRIEAGKEALQGQPGVEIHTAEAGLSARSQELRRECDVFHHHYTFDI